MTTVTNEIVTNQMNSEGEFSLMVTSIPTGEYEDNSAAAGFILFFMPFSMVMIGNLGAMIISVSHEKNEDKLQNILKRIGYRESIDVTQKVILFAFSTLCFFTPCGLLILFLVLKGISVPLGLAVLYLVATEMLLLEMVLKYSFKGAMAIVIKLAYYGIQMFVLISYINTPTIPPEAMYLQSCFPMTALGTFAKLVMQAET